MSERTHAELLESLRQTFGHSEGWFASVGFARFDRQL
jgi:hypothetical protein